MIDKINKWLPIVTVLWLVILTLVLVGGNQPDSESGDLAGTGTRFVNGVGVGSQTMTVRKNWLQASSTVLFSGALTELATSTCQQASTSTLCYETKGGIDLAFNRLAFTATTGAPVSFDNPYAATTSIDKILCEWTAGIGGTAPNTNFFVGTTTNAAPHSTTSSRMLVANFAVPPTETPTLLWTPRSGTSTASSPFLLEHLGGDANSNGSPFFLAPTERIVLKAGSSTPGGGSWTGSCSAWYSKP